MFTYKITYTNDDEDTVRAKGFTETGGGDYMFYDDNGTVMTVKHATVRKIERQGD